MVQTAFIGLVAEVFAHPDFILHSLRLILWELSLYQSEEDYLMNSASPGLWIYLNRTTDLSMHLVSLKQNSGNKHISFFFYWPILSIQGKIFPTELEFGTKQHYLATYEKKVQVNALWILLFTEKLMI